MLSLLIVAALAALVSASESGDWPRYNGDFQSTRHSALAAVTRSNAGRLRPICIFDTHQRGSFQSGILAVGGTLYFTSSLETYAIDGNTCARRWIVKRDLQAAAPWPVNRGLAYADGRLFRATTDGHFVALDARSGKLLWDVKIFDTGTGGWVSAAPVAWKNLVIIGTAGADVGVNGHIFGIDAATGRIRWTFDTIDKTTSSQWPPAAAAHGGGSTWSSFTIDPATGELFVPIGNPAPDFAPGARKGENAYTDSVLVLDAVSGKYRWHTQQVEGDFHDWDTAAAPTLLTAASGTSMVLAPSKDGHVYITDRHDHRLLRRVETTTIRNASAPLTTKGTHFCPGTLGGTEWNGGSYDAARKLFFVPAIDWCSTLKGDGTASNVEYTKGQPYLGTSNGYGDYDSTKSGWLNAIDPVSGRRVWRFHAGSPMVSGVVSTDGGIVAAGDYDGNFRVFDSGSGRTLYSYNVSEPLAGGVITYRSGGAQRFAFTAGNTSRTPLPSRGTSRVFVLGLDGPEHPVTVAEDASRVVSVGKAAALDGAKLYANNCAGCHGASAQGAGSTYPPLVGNAVMTGPPATLIHIVKYGLSGKIVVGSKTYNGQMPAWAAQLSDAQIAAVLTYLRRLHGNGAGLVSASQVTAVKQ